ncbi:putative DNA-binding domain-containing protein [Altererythrobacter sp. MF3-039]|uniref:HvfC/BufC family peptide modification chaperone n=1 Tax=Altererythrobacter sp. MF3-039 TaxID=3252901 RepID=UPI00390C9652
MTALAQQQAEFMSQILDDERAPPEGWNDRHAAGMSVYRNNYRTALVEALRSTFEQTERWAGGDSFKRAAAHHLIAHPPSSWTLDEAGSGFEETCTELFAQNPEVSELAWLEWAMHRAFVAADHTALTLEEFAEQSSSFGEDDWVNLRLTIVPGLRFRTITQDCAGLWRALKNEESPPEQLALAEPAGLAVWREDLTPVFQSIDLSELGCLELIVKDGSYGDCCTRLVERLGEEEAIPFAGTMLGRWLANGWIAALIA